MIFGSPCWSMTPLALVNRAAAEALEHLDRLGVLLQVRDGDRAVGDDQVEAAAVGEVDERVAPAGRGPAAERPREPGRLGDVGGLAVVEHLALVGGVRLAARVR